MQDPGTMKQESMECHAGFELYSPFFVGPTEITTQSTPYREAHHPQIQLSSEKKKTVNSYNSISELGAPKKKTNGFRLTW